MAIEFKLPDVGEGLHEAELLQWLVKEGDMVREDQPLLEVQTDKASVEITSPVKGKVAKLNGKVGDILHVGSVVVVFDDGTGASLPVDQTVNQTVAQTPNDPQAPANVTPAPAAAATAAAQAPAPAPAAAAPAAAAAAAAPGGRALAAPATRKMAREMGIDINQVAGSGPAGRVTPDDLKRFAAGGPAAAPAAAAAAPAPAAEAAPAAVAAAAPAAPAPQPYVSPAGAVEERLPLKGIRKIIADRMVLSKHTAPHVTITEEVDMTELVAFRAKAKEVAAKKGIKLSFMPFIFKALTAALKEFPFLNASIDDAKQEIVLKKYYHMGYAFDTEAGLMVPVIKDIDKKSIFTIAQEMQDQIARGHAGKLAADELKGSTFTVSNMGSIGGLHFTPVINYPEVAILGVGKTQERPVVRNGEIVIRDMCYLSISFDHRLIDGAMASRFISRVVELLSNPTLLMMEA